MARYASKTITFTTALAIGALAAGTLTTAELGTAPTAQATCASFFGIGNNADCFSTPLSIAIAIGPGAQAFAKGLFGAAFAAGNGAQAYAPTAFEFGVAVGSKSEAIADGWFGIAAQFGPNGVAGTQGDPVKGGLGFNIAISVTTKATTVSGGSDTDAIGVGNIAINIFGDGTKGNVLDNQVLAYGVANTAVNLFGNNNSTKAGLLKNDPASFSSAFTVFGTDNVVEAGPGPVAVAGSLFQKNAKVTKQGPGFNINGVVVGGAAATGATKSAAAAHHPAKPAAASRGGNAKR